MPDQHVDYDRIAPSYDQRYAANGLERVADVLLTLADNLAAERILEVGCGTGRWLAELAKEGRQLCGLDLSTGMLREARVRRAGFELVRGRGSQLSFSEAVFDLVICVNALHHFDAPRAFICAARRLLRPSGVLAVVGSDPHAGRGAWYVYDYFPGTLETDLRRFPSWGTVLEWMVTEGFETVQWQLVQRIVDHKVGRAVFDDPFLRKTACSQLALLSDGAYTAGLQRIASRVDRAEAAGERVVFPVELHIGALIGQSPSDKDRTRT